MGDQRCPECGNELPSELGQHSVTPLTGRATCPHCGVDVHVARPEPGAEAAPGASAEAAPGASGAPAEAGGGPGEPEKPESFSGEETLGGVMDEVEEKNEDA